VYRLDVEMHSNLRSHESKMIEPCPSGSLKVENIAKYPYDYLLVLNS
jgi:hypothetical protein